ncbi:6-bladed beta-propeller [Aestuariibaculum sp. M13]|uniref:6-bladed beta-propeller n=1 Tax=Aestuariibaculum sp. M13 TaxID=2967132 RepID=UPI002159D200|nr:6-bladed beta-propeller [Aestuariibaculum sp. M13]MCR8667544.1 6-bladed beta-propeller [Aestuariibaculum sp. M13]
MKKNIYILLLIICSCQNSEFKDDLKTIEFNYNMPDENLKISDICNQITYVELETSDLSLVGNVTKIVASEDYIIILDKTGKLVVFNSNGKFLNIINHQGRGPNEYTEITDFSFLEEDGLIAIYSRVNDRSVYLYSLDGKYVDDFKIKYESENLYNFNNNFIFYNSHFFRNQSNYYSLNITSRQGKHINQLMRKELETSYPFFYQYDKKNKLFKLGDELVFWEKGFDNGVDTIWKINKKFEVYPKYKLNIGGEKFPLSRYADKNKIPFREKLEKTDLMNYYESNKYVFFEIINESKFCRFVYDKKETNLKRIYEGKTEKQFEIMLNNDLDGGTSFWPIGNISDDKMFMLIQGYEIKDFLERQGEDFVAKNPVARQKLLKMVKNSKISDNPILMVATLKE